MASHVQVILKQDIHKLGNAGEVVRVKPGYARNFLLPRKLAVVATGGNMKQIEHERRIAQVAADKLRKIAEGAAAQIEGLTLEIVMKAGEGDKLYGSVTSRDIADALAARGIDADRKKLELDQTIKTLGEHKVQLKLGHEVSASFTVVVVPAA
ncbi:MAG: 50S ribosomal protein L9 [Myxococcales bacterium]|nr:50S ribosomal protein L9 [Myxococcales bacterium]